MWHIFSIKLYSIFLIALYEIQHIPRWEPHHEVWAGRWVGVEVLEKTLLPTQQTESYPSYLTNSFLNRNFGDENFPQNQWTFAGITKITNSSGKLALEAKMFISLVKDIDFIRILHQNSSSQWAHGVELAPHELYNISF